MTLQSTPNLLTWWSVGLHFDDHQKPHPPSVPLGYSSLASSDDLSKQLEPPSSSSSLDVDRYHIPGAYRESFSDSSPGCDDRDSPRTRQNLFHMLAQKLRPLANSDGKDFRRHQPQLFSIPQVKLPPCPSRHDDVSLVPRPLVTRKSIRRSYSYEQGDDQGMTASMTKRNSGLTVQHPERKEAALQKAQEKLAEEQLAIRTSEKLQIHKSSRDLYTNHPGGTVSESDSSPTGLLTSKYKGFEISSRTDTVHHRATHRYESQDELQLGFEDNEVFTVSRKLENGWWFGTRLSNGESGWIPSPYFDPRPISESTEPLAVDLPRRQPAVRQKKSLKRRAVYGKVDPEQGETMEFYRRVSQMILSTRECVVCGESKAVAEFPDSARSQCQHEWKTCRGCVRQWIVAQLDAKGWDRIACPDVECKAFLGHADILQLADKDTFQRYETLATRAYLSTLPNFRWCLSATCESGQIHDADSAGSIFKCASCGLQWCTQHEAEWHRGETCKQYDQRVSREQQDREERATKRMLAKTTKKCPGRGCGWMIEKNQGCDHMTCRQCKHEFCYVCLAPYEPIRRHGNSRHKKGCKYHSDNVR